jgi:hypothetical protein
MTQRKLLLTIALVIAVLTGSPQKSASLAAAESLDLNTFLNQDLRKADSNHVANLVRFLDAQGTNTHKRWFPQPWFVWKLEDKSVKGCFVVFEGQPIFMTPGTSSAVVHLFDPGAKHLTSSAFSTGWRIDLKTASFIEEPSLGAQVIELRTEPTRPTQNIPRRQIYGLVGHRVALIRLEGSQGELFRNTYIYPNQTIGPPPPPRTADQWEAALKSNNYIETLEALMWLGGRHLDTSDVSDMRLVSGVSHENVRDARLFAEVWQRQSVQKVLDSLAESKINWISAAAKLAKGKDTRP